VAQLSDDCFAGDDALVPAQAALDLILPRLTRVTGSLSLPLVDCLDRILAEDVIAAIDVPGGDNSAVDGYAVYFADLDPASETTLPIGGRAAAGHPLGRAQRRGEAVRIFTGAPMPPGEAGGPGPDTVMMQEDCQVIDGRVVIRAGIRRGANRRKAGEDVAAASRALVAGIRLRPQDIGLAAALGLTRLPVVGRLKVALFSTGDELAEPGATLSPGAIYDSNRFTLAALLAQLGCAVTDLGILPDRLEAISRSLAEAARDHALLLTSGGVSTGEEDHVKAAVAALGRLHVWRLAIKPGRPIALGQVDAPGGAVPFIGLPGNPVAVMVTFLRIARPIILRLMGADGREPLHFPVRAAFDYKKKASRREWVRVRLEPGADGVPVAHKYPRDGAGILRSMVESDGLVELPEDLVQLAAGSMVDFLPFSEVR
jgi:molybdopterin molybdotransferase